MATTVTYKGATLTTVDNQTKVLETAGTWLEDDLTLVDVSGGGGYTADDLLYGQIGGSINFTGTKLPAKMSAIGQAITSVNLPNVTTLKIKDGLGDTALPNELFAYCPNMTSFHAPSATNTVDKLLFGNSSLVDVNLDSLTDTGSQMMNGCSSVTVMVLPNVQVCYSNCFANCTSLTAVDILGSNYIHSGIFGNDTNLTVLVIRKNGVCTLQNTNNFNGTPFASGGSGGTLYVPSAQISNYQGASNWSTILGYANNQIKAIEGSIYETKYADGRTI